MWEREKEEQQTYYRDDGPSKAAGQPGMKLSETTAGPVWVLCIGADPSYFGFLVLEMSLFHLHS